MQISDYSKTYCHNFTLINLKFPFKKTENCQNHRTEIWFLWCWSQTLAVITKAIKAVSLLDRYWMLEMMQLFQKQLVGLSQQTKNFYFSFFFFLPHKWPGFSTCHRAMSCPQNISSACRKMRKGPQILDPQGGGDFKNNNQKLAAVAEMKAGNRVPVVLQCSRFCSLNRPLKLLGMLDVLCSVRTILGDVAAWFEFTAWSSSQI